MAGVKDAWTRSDGQTQATLNFAFATLDALKQTTRIALREQFKEHVHIGKAGEVHE
jgi:ribosomal protein S5